MSFLLDTDICSAYLKGDQSVFQKAIQHGGRIHISVINQVELLTWTYRAGAPQSRASALASFLSGVSVLEFGGTEAEQTARIRSAQLDQGRPSPTVDLMIAATALVHNLTLVTHNVADFGNISGLRVDDWLSA